MESICNDKDIADALGWGKSCDGDEDDEEFEFCEPMLEPDPRERKQTGYDIVFQSIEKMKKKSRYPSTISTNTRSTLSNKAARVDKPNIQSQNEVAVAVVIQRIVRGWLARIKVKSLMHIREKLEQAIRVRTTKQLQLALTASKALAHFYQIKEHAQARNVMFSLSEEEALKAKIYEIIEVCEKKQEKIPCEMYTQIKPVIDRINKCRDNDRLAFRSLYAEQFLRISDAAIAQKDALDMLIRARDEKPRKVKSLADAVYFFDTNRAKFKSLWPDSYGIGEYTTCRSYLIKIQHEDAPLRTILKLCTEGFAIYSKEAGKLDLSSLDTASLSDAIHDCEEIEAMESSLATSGGTQILNLGRAVVEMRVSLKYSVENDEGWDEVKKSIKKCRDALESAIQERYEKSDDADQEPGEKEEDNIFVVAKALETEMRNIEVEMDSRSGYFSTLDEIRVAIDSRDTSGLEQALGKAKSIGLFDRKSDIETQNILLEGQSFLEVLAPVYTGLARTLILGNKVDAIIASSNQPYSDLYRAIKETKMKGTISGLVQKKSFDELELIINLATHNNLSFNGPGTKDGWLLDEAIRLHELSKNKLIPLLQEYVSTIPDRGNMEAIVKICDHEGLILPFLDEVRGYLHLSEDRLQQEQLRAATRNNNKIRKFEVMIRVRETLLNQNGSMFILSKYPGLKDPDTYGRRMGIKNKALSMGMLKWTTEPIHTSLTELDEPIGHASSFAISSSSSSLGTVASSLAEMVENVSSGSSLKKIAMKMFKNVLVYMEDREGDQVLEAGQEVLVTGLGTKALRDEIYVQLMKQLTDNPSKKSMRLGWNLMALCCVTFPPSNKLDYYLEQFLRSKANEDLEKQSLKVLEKLHNTLFQGERPCAPTLSDIERCRDQGGNIRGFSFKIVDANGD